MVPRTLRCNLHVAAMLKPAWIALLSLSLLQSCLATRNTSLQYSWNAQSPELSVRGQCSLRTQSLIPHSLLSSVRDQVRRGLIISQHVDSMPLAERCPPCFNCQLPAFSCGHFGDCSTYDGQCKCPAGWAGIDCLTPRKQRSHFIRRDL